MLQVAKKYILSFDESFREEVLDLLKGEWNFEVNQIKEEESDSLADIDYKIANASFAINFLTPWTKKESLIAKLKKPKILVQKSAADSFDFNRPEKTVSSLVDIESELKSLESAKKEKEETMAQLSLFGTLSFVPRETEATRSFVISADTKKQEDLIDVLVGLKAHWEIINQFATKTYLSVIVLKDLTDDLLSFVQDNSSVGIIEYGFDDIPANIIKRLKDELSKIEKRKEEIERHLFEIGKRAKDLKVYHDLLCIAKRKKEVAAKSLFGGFLRHVSFWATGEEKEKIEKEIRGISEKARIIEAGYGEEEQPPVMLKNSGAVSPFQAVTDIFGLPGKDELDPTPYLSLFFIVYFGICITDAGYGLILALLTGGLLFFFKDTFKNNNLIKLLFYAGIATFITGVLFGSYFGVSAEQIGIPFMSKFKIIDPIKDTLLFMGIAFLFGYIQICFSQVVKMISSRRQKNKDGIISGLVWLCFYLSFGIYLLGVSVLGGLTALGLSGLLVFGLSLFWVEGKGQKIFLIPLVGAIKILQGTINTVSDILSYSRLMALGLGTGVIALIVNQIAFLLGGMIPYVGWILTGLILVFGHIFNLGINALGGFIHSARLQFVEFFPKFMEGGGRRLNPVAQGLKYIKINNQ